MVVVCLVSWGATGLPASPSNGLHSLYLIDGSAYIYRAFHAVPPLSTSKGLPTNAVFGFTNMLMKLLREHHPEYLAVVFDEKGPTHRHVEYAEYKAHRPEMPESMQIQIPYIHKIVGAFGLPVVKLSGYEADDLIGTLARQAEGEGYQVAIVTGDKDMFQLLSDKTTMYDPVKEKWLGEADCRARFGVEPGRVVEVMGLMGDAADHIPGVKGIGEKTAIKLIAKFGTIENLLQQIQEVTPPRVRSLLIEQGEQARLSKKLATILLDCPVEFDPTGFQVKPFPQDSLVPVLREMEFTNLLKVVEGPGQQQEAYGDDVKIIRDESALEKFVANLSPPHLVALHLVLGMDNGQSRGDYQGAALSTTQGGSVFFTGHARSGHPILKRVLHNTDRTKAFHDLKKTLLVLGEDRASLQPPFFDTMVADYLLHPNHRAHGVQDLAHTHLGYTMRAAGSHASASPTSLFEGGEESCAAEAAEQAAVIARLVPLQTHALHAQGSLRVFEDVEMPLVPILAEIELNGFALNTGVLTLLSKELEGGMSRIVNIITHVAGQEFNVNSPRQLATVLFETLGLKPIRKTKTGYSTDEDTLTQLATHHALPSHILQYRSLSKLKSTYVDSLPSLVNRATGRLHTSLHQTVAATGRLSSAEPNLQNIPVKGEYGPRIREAFVAPSGHTLLCADYSQIEPRILAHVSQDERLMTVFERGEDIHTATAVDIFNLSADQISRDMRRIAKTVVFGIVYGISPYGLSQTLGISHHEAKNYIDAYFARYSRVKQFLDHTIEEARDQGYTTTLLGRRRPIPELQSSDQTQRSFGERMAVNSPIQGSAADVIKLAMIAVHNILPSTLPGTKMILQVHDELIFEVPDRDVEQAKGVVRSAMEGVGAQLGLSVPLKVDVGTGPNWRAAHP